MLTYHQESLFELAGLNIVGQRGMGSAGDNIRFDFLDLPGVSTTGQPVYGKCTVQVTAEQVEAPTYPGCTCLPCEVKPHSPFIQSTILDVPHGRKSLCVTLKRRRWKCKSCGDTVTQPLYFMAADHHRITQRLLEYIQVEALLRTDLNVAEETGVCVRTVREIRTKFVERLRREVQFETPRVLGLDGVRADASRRIIFTDIEKGLVLDLITSGCKDSIRGRLEAFPLAHQIQIVLIDMCRTLHHAVLEGLPLATIIIDRFHIMRIANQVMDKVRNRLFPKRKKDREPGQTERPRPEPFRQRRGPAGEAGREHRERWFAREPELELAYNLKEDFLEGLDRETYTVEPMSKGAARRRYGQWEQSLPKGKEYKELQKDFRQITTTMAYWGEYVFNYFDFPFTNAFTESMNRKIKDTKRETRGCSFNTAQGRAVFGHFIRKQMIEAREQEAAIIRKPSKRRRKAKPTSIGTAGKFEESAASLYRVPRVVQVSLDFTN